MTGPAATRDDDEAEDPMDLPDDPDATDGGATVPDTDEDGERVGGDSDYAPAETAVLGGMLDQALGRESDPFDADEGLEPDDDLGEDDDIGDDHPVLPNEGDKDVGETPAGAGYAPGETTVLGGMLDEAMGRGVDVTDEPVGVGVDEGELSDRPLD